MFSMSTLYLPGGRCQMRNRPSLPVVVDLAWIEFGLTAVTFTPDTPAPSKATIMPSIEPVEAVCAVTVGPKRIRHKVRIALTIRMETLLIPSGFVKHQRQSG